MLLASKIKGEGHESSNAGTFQRLEETSTQIFPYGLQKEPALPAACFQLSEAPAVVLLCRRN